MELHNTLEEHSSVQRDRAFQGLSLDIYTVYESTLHFDSLLTCPYCFEILGGSNLECLRSLFHSYENAQCFGELV